MVAPTTPRSVELVRCDLGVFHWLTLLSSHAMMLGTGGGSKHESMNERECLKAIEAILMRFDAGERQDNGSRSDSEAGSAVLDTSDPESGSIAGPEGLGDSDDLGRAQRKHVKAFIQRTRPQARRTGRQRGR